MDQKKKETPNNKVITTEGDLKRFARQLENKNMTDSHFKKAYEWFKRPAYGQKEESNGD